MDFVREWESYSLNRVYQREKNIQQKKGKPRHFGCLLKCVRNTHRKFGEHQKKTYER